MKPLPFEAHVLTSQSGRRSRRRAGRVRRQRFGPIGSIATGTQDIENQKPSGSAAKPAERREEDRTDLESPDSDKSTGNRFALLSSTEPAPGPLCKMAKAVQPGVDSSHVDWQEKAKDAPDDSPFSAIKAPGCSRMKPSSPVQKSPPSLETSRSKSTTPPQSDLPVEYSATASIVPSAMKTKRSQVLPRSPDSRLKHSLPAKPPAKRGPPSHIRIPIAHDPRVRNLPTVIQNAVATENDTASQASPEAQLTSSAITPKSPRDDNLEQPLTAVITQPAQGLPSSTPSYADIVAHRQDPSPETATHTSLLTPMTSAQTSLKDPSPEEVEAQQDLLIRLPTPENPMQPATKDRQSRFFPRSSRLHRPHLRAAQWRAQTPTMDTSAPAAGKPLPTPPVSPAPSFKLLSPRPTSGTESKQPSPPSTSHAQHIPLRTLPWKWWHSDLPRLRPRRPSVPPIPESKTTELQKPKSLEKEEAKAKPDFVPSLAGEWEFVEQVCLRAGAEDNDDEEMAGLLDGSDSSSGEWVWKCGEGCRCMRRGSYA